MRTRQQRLVFCVSGFLSCCSALTASVATGLPLWVSGAALCRTGAELVNATGTELQQFMGRISYGLFTGERVKQCGLGGRTARFYLFSELLSALPAGLHVTVLFFCGAVILFSAVASGFFFYNALGRPYELLHGPMGLYLWTSVSCVSSLLVMVLFAAEVKLYHLSARISNYNESTYVFTTHSESYDRCYWLFLLVFMLHAISAALVRLAGIQLPFNNNNKGVELNIGAADLMY
ncbi:clarin-1 [Gouania willdenowi]|uniref:Clarin-1-like n=1 Tax=Gouania willdenowi TaxID=441366 RepID=A0A8C5EA35_GOUWI|nr:clarin-1-like [Gouania willdenowi]